MKPFSISNVALTLAITSALAGCGGNNIDPTTGKIVDGYVSGATVILDVNDNRAIDSTDPTTTADATGNFNFTGAQNPNGGAHMVFAKGGTDISTGLPFVGQLSAPPGATQVTPLTSVVMAKILASVPAGTPISTQTATDAAASVATSLGLSGVSLLTTDPVAAAATTPALIQTTAAVQVLLQQVTSTVQAAAGSGVAQAGTNLSNAIYQNALSAVASSLSTAAAPLANPAAISSIAGNVISTTVTNAKADATVTNLVSTPSTLTALNATNIATAGAATITTLVTNVANASATTLGSLSASSTNPATIAQADTTAASATAAAANGGVLPNVLLINSYSVNGTAVANNAVAVTGPINTAALTLTDVGAALPTAGSVVSIGFDATDAQGRQMTIIVDNITLTNGTGGQVNFTVGTNSKTTAYGKHANGSVTSLPITTAANFTSVTQNGSNTTITLNVANILAALTSGNTGFANVAALKGVFTAKAAISSGVQLANTSTTYAGNQNVTIGNVQVAGSGTTATLTVN